MVVVKGSRRSDYLTQSVRLRIQHRAANGSSEERHVGHSALSACDDPRQCYVVAGPSFHRHVPRPEPGHHLGTCPQGEDNQKLMKGSLSLVTISTAPLVIPKKMTPRVQATRFAVLVVTRVSIVGYIISPTFS